MEEVWFWEGFWARFSSLARWCRGPILRPYPTTCSKVCRFESHCAQFWKCIKLVHQSECINCKVFWIWRFTDSNLALVFFESLTNQWRQSSGGSRPGVLGDSQMGSHQTYHLLTQGSLWQSLDITQKWSTFVGQESGYFCWSNYSIFQRLTTVWKRIILLIKKTFEADSKRWASFFTS